MTPLPPSQPRRILVRGTNWLGDAVMTTPALARLRERFPQAHVVLLTHEKLADLWQEHPSLDSILTFPADAGLWYVASLLRKESRTNRFDVALVLPNSPRSALETWLARIPQRVGYAGRWRKGFLTHAVAAYPGLHPMRKRSAGEVRRLVAHPGPPFAPASTAHQIHHYLHLGAALGADARPSAPHLAVTPRELDEARLNLSAGKWAPWNFPPSDRQPVLLGLNPGAEYGPAKRWPAANFAAVAAEVARRIDNAVWLLFGAAKDQAIAAEILGACAARQRIVNLAGKTSLRELMALLKLCRVLVTNDTGPMHVAAALGTPVVVPFGSTSPELTGPGLPGDPRHRVLKANAPCSPCFQRTCPLDLRCLTGISSEQVVAEVLKALEQPGGKDDA